MAFHVGQKVVCVDADSPVPGEAPDSVWGTGEAVVTGQTYTVRRFYLRKGHPTLWLDEVCRNPSSVVHWGVDVGYGAWRFRPVIERKTDISIFTAMLTPNRVNA